MECKLVTIMMKMVIILELMATMIIKTTLSQIKIMEWSQML